MKAFNVVRFRVKPGREQHFIDVHKEPPPAFKGFVRASLVKTGERAYWFIGEWDSFDSIVAARPLMIGQLDKVRDDLEDLGGGLGVTDPVSGEQVVEIKP